MTEVISGRTRPNYVLYPRWYALILSYFGTEYEGAPEDDFPIIYSSHKPFSTEPAATDPHITKGMDKWISRPYEAERFVYVPPSEDAATSSPSAANDNQSTSTADIIHSPSAGTSHHSASPPSSSYHSSDKEMVLFEPALSIKPTIELHLDDSTVPTPTIRCKHPPDTSASPCGGATHRF